MSEERGRKIRGDKAKAPGDVDKGEREKRLERTGESRYERRMERAGQNGQVRCQCRRKESEERNTIHERFFNRAVCRSLKCVRNYEFRGKREAGK